VKGEERRVKDENRGWGRLLIHMKSKPLLMLKSLRFLVIVAVSSLALNARGTAARRVSASEITRHQELTER
jgi:hypothetical protein